MKITLYVLPASHPCRSVELMLERKELRYRRVELPGGLSGLILRAMRFPGRTVPALRVDGRRIQGSLEISRALEELEPDPPLFPAEPEARRRVEQAERWGEQTLQNGARRIEIWILRRDRAGVASQLASSRLPIPTGLAARMSAPFLRRYASLYDVTDETVERDLAQLPRVLDHVDRLIAEGTIGGDQPNAADFQIAPSLALLMTMDQLGPAIARQPSGEFARRLVSSYPGRLGAVLPSAWLRPLGVRR